jgi:urease gamma subunit
MIRINIEFKGEPDIPPSYVFYEYRDRLDEIAFHNIVYIIQKKLSNNLKINLYETLIIYCSYIVNELRSKKSIASIQKNAQNLLLSDNVMIGVPNLLKSILFQVNLDDYDHFFNLLFQEPLKIDYDMTINHINNSHVFMKNKNT